MLLEGDCGFHTIAEAILDLLYLPLLSFPTSPPCAFPQLFSFGFCLLFAFRNRPEHSPSAAASLFFYYFRCAGAGGQAAQPSGTKQLRLLFSFTEKVGVRNQAVNCM